MNVPPASTSAPAPPAVTPSRPPAPTAAGAGIVMSGHIKDCVRKNPGRTGRGFLTGDDFACRSSGLNGDLSFGRAERAAGDGEIAANDGYGQARLHFKGWRV